MKRSPCAIPTLFPTFFLASVVSAGTIWDGGGADNLWGSGANWNDDASPSTGATVDLSFTGATRLNPVNNYTSFDDFHSLIFDSGATGSFDVGGSAIDIFGKIENHSSLSQTVSLADLAINSGQSGTGEFNPVNGNLNINSSNVFTNGNTLRVYGANGKTLTFGASTVISGTGHFNVEQASNVVYLGNNTYSGTTNVLAGSLTVGNGGTTGTLGTDTVTVASGATLTFNRSDAVSLSQTLNIGGGLVKNGAGALTISGAQTGFTGSVIINAGRITMGANNSLGTAAVTLNGGTIERNAGNISVANNIAIGASGGTILGRQVVDAYTDFSGVISGSGTLTVQGLVQFSNTGNAHSGNITVSNASSTYFRLSASEVLGNSSAVTMGGANTNFRLDGGVTETIGSLAGSGNLFVSKTGAVLPGTLKFGGDNSSTSYTGQVNNNDGQLFLVKQGSGTFTLSPSAASFQGLTISNGTVLAGNGTYGSATITLGDADTGSNNVAFLTTTAGSSRAITVSSSGAGTATIGSTTGAGSGNVVFSGVQTLNRATTFTAASTDRTTWTGKITGNVGTLTFAGSQRIVLESANGLNDFVGDVVISGTGTVLQIGAGTLTGENIPNTANVTVNAGAFLKLASTAGGTETINALNGTGNVRRHETVGGVQTLVIGAANGSGSFGGTLTNGSGTLAIRKEGTGTQTITSVSGNTASAGITVNGGTLKFAGVAGFDAGTFSTAQTYTVNTGGTLEIQGDWLTKSTSTYNITGGTLAFTKTTGDATLSYVNNLNLTNGTVTGPGNYRIGNNTTATHTFSGDSGNVVSSGFGLVKNGAAQTVNLTVNDGASDTDLLVSGVIYDVSGFTGSTLNKQGLGKMVVTAANTYAGPTTITAGTLQVGNGGTTGSLGSGAITNDSALVLNRSNDFTFPNLISGSGSLSQVGSGNATLTGNNSYSGGTTLSQGTLTAGHANAFGSGTITLASGATLDINNLNIPNTINNNGGTILGSSGSASITQSGGTLSGTLGGVITASGTIAGSPTVTGTLFAGPTASFTGQVTAESGGFVRGTGTLAGGLVINSGGTVSPGNSPGTLNAGNTVWNGGGSYVWEVNDATGGTGGDPGHDLLAITGTLDMSGASPSNKFNLLVTSLTLANAAGDAVNFAAGSPGHTWTIVSTSAGVTGFDASAFNLNLAAFTNTHLGSQFWSLQLANSGLDIQLVYVPEPSTYAAFAGLAVLCLAWRRRCQGTTPPSAIS